MSKNGKIDHPDGNDDREDIQWFENYERHSKTKHLERLKNKDILNFIKDVERNCRLEVNSADEDYAGIKRSSNFCVRCSGTRFRSLRKVKSKLMSTKNKNMTLARERKPAADHNATGTCGYCCSARKSHFRGSSKLTARENSRRDLDNSNKSVYPNLSRNSYKYGEPSPTLYGWYSRKKYREWPAVTETASLEVTEDWSRNATHNSRINRSNIADGKSAKVHTSKLLRGNKFHDSCHVNICPNIAANEKTMERDARYRDGKHREDTRMRKLNGESDVGDFENQQPVDKIYSDQDRMLSQAALRNRGCNYSSGCHYPVRRPVQPVSWNFTWRPDERLTSTRLETSSLLYEQTSQRENEVAPPLRTFNSIMGTSINRGYQRETNRKNNTNRRPGILGDQESPCYCRPGLLRESGKLYEAVAPTHEGKQCLGCCEIAERDEMVDYFGYWGRPENANELIRLQRVENAYGPGPMSERDNYTAATLPGPSPKSVQLDNDEEEFDTYLSIEEESQDEDAARDNHAFAVFEDANNCDGAIDLRDLKPHVSFLDDRARRGSNEVAREYKKLSNDLKSNQGEAMGARTAAWKKINARYSADEEFSSAARTPGKPVSGDSSGFKYAAASTCECREPFHVPPAACLIGSCTCIGRDENARRNKDDLSRRIRDTVYCCSSPSCSSFASHDEKDPVKKLESFCERVKAVNQDIFHKPSKYVHRNATSADAQASYVHGDEQNQSEFGTQRTVRRARSVEGEWLEDPARLGLEKPRRHRAKLEKILIYPPRGEGGPPLTLYKRSSNISCRVKGDADTGFRYSVTYVQKFVSPTWMPALSAEVLSRETNKEYDCSADYD